MKLTKLQESGLRKIVAHLNENTLAGNDAKVAAQMVSGLASVPYPKHSTNDKFLIESYDKISDIRMEIMRYVEANSGYKFAPKGGNNWKLVKK